MPAGTYACPDDQFVTAVTVTESGQLDLTCTTTGPDLPVPTE